MTFFSMYYLLACNLVVVDLIFVLEGPFKTFNCSFE